MKRISTLAVALSIASGILCAEDAPPPVGFFEALQLPALSSQDDRFQIYDSPTSQSLLHNLANNREDQFGLADSSRRGDRGNLFRSNDGAENVVGQIRVRQEATLPLTAVKTKLDVPDPFDQTSPQLKKTWKADEQVKLFIPELDSIFLFGQVKSGGDLYRQADTDFTGKTGVGVKWSPLPETELQLRTGRQLSLSDFTTANANTLDRSQFLVEVLAKMPVPVPLMDGTNLHLEYIGSSVSAATATDRSVLTHDLRIVLPAGKLNEFYVGVTHKMSADSSTNPLTDKNGIYIGITIKH